MEQRLSIVTLGVKDLSLSTEFYTDQFGWTKSEHSTDGISFFHLNGMMLALYPLEEFEKEIEGLKLAETGANRMTLAFLSRTEEGVDELFADFKKKKVKILKEPEKVFWGGYSGYIADPDGNLWEIAYNPFIKLNEKGSLLR